MDEYVAKFTSLLRYVPYIPESNSPKGKALQSSHYIFSLYNIGVTKDLFHTSLNSQRDTWFLDIGETWHMNFKKDFIEDLSDHVDGEVYFSYH